MSCEHAQSTTLSWLYGELDDDAHAAHVAVCEDCQAVLADHELVAAAMPVAAPSIPEPANKPWRWALLAAAAAAAVAAGWWLAPRPAAPDDTAVAVAPALDDQLFAADIDSELDALDADLERLAADLETL